MENLPFLAKSSPELPSRNVPSQEPDAPRWPEPPEPPSRRFVPLQEPKKDPFAALKENHVALILLGIVIGVIIMNMRPIIVNPK
jgi:hypothetical protein